MKPFKALLFDLDDTLYDFSGNWERALQKTFGEHPLTGGLDQLAVIAAFNHYSTLHWSLVHTGAITFDEYRFKRLASALADFRISLGQEDFLHFNAVFIENNLTQIRRNDSLIRLMEDWAESYRLGIITNGPADLAGKKVKRLGLEELFPDECIVVSGRTGYAKPQEEIFHYGLNKLGVASHEAVFIGDSWEDDVTGAVKAGLAAIWLAKEEGAAAKSPDVEPLAVIHALAEAKRYI